jgi:plastin-1
MQLINVKYPQLNVKLKQQAAPVLPSKAGKVTVKGSNANVSHTINEDEREQFTSHINGVSSVT